MEEALTFRPNYGEVIKRRLPLSLMIALALLLLTLGLTFGLPSVYKELDADDGELTRTNKVRRGFIADKYGVLVEALYGGRTEQFI